MSDRWRRILQRSLPVGVSAVVLGWLLRQVDGPALLDALTPRVAIIMVPALCAFGAATLWIEALSLRRLVGGDAHGFGAWTAARIKCASYLPGVIHYTLGVATVALLLRRRTGMLLGEAASLVLLVSSTDLLVVLTAASASAALIGVAAPGLRSGMVVVVLVGFLGGLAVLRAPASLGPLDRLRQLAIFEGLRTLPLRRLAELLALRVAFSGCFVAGCASAFAAFEIQAPPALLVGGILVVALVGALPIAVAGLGTTQAAFLYLFADVAPAPKLLAMSLVLSFGMLALRAAMGLVFARELTREAIQGVRSGQA